MKLTFLRILAATTITGTLAMTAFGAPNSRAMREALVADYPLTQVGQVMLKPDYTRITKPGVILAIRLPGIYADEANTENAIVNTNYANGQISQASGFAAAFGGSTAQSRTLKPNEQVYVTDILIKKDAVQMELLSVDVATLGNGLSTRYRAELNIKLPGLETMSLDEVKKTIDTVVAGPSVASAADTKSIRMGMTPDQVKAAFGNPDKIVDLGSKQIYSYKDMKVILMDGKVSDVQ